MAIIISHSHFVYVEIVSILVFQTFVRIIFGTLTFPGTRCWQYGTHKWYAIRKRLGTTDLLSSDTSFQPSVPWLRVCLWCNLSIV